MCFNSSYKDVKFIKITICSPSWFHQRHGSDYTYDISVYKNDGENNRYSYHVQPNVILDEYFDDLGVAYRAELKELYELGCRMLYASFCHILRVQSLFSRKHPDRRPHFLLFLR